VTGESRAFSTERRTRIVCHLPMNRRPDQRAAKQVYVVYDFIEFLAKSELTGFSMSSLMDTVFTGFWRAHPTHAFEEENVVLFMIDHPLDRNDPALWKLVARMKREIQTLYKRYTGEKEQEIWIITHAIDRLV
jgi:hypothetical protein